MENVLKKEPIIVAEGHSYSNYYAIGLNTLIGIFVMAYVGYFIGYYWYNSYYYGLIFALIFSISILLIEGILFMSRSYLIDFEQNKNK